MSAGNRRVVFVPLEASFSVGAGTCEEVDKIRGRSAALADRALPGSNSRLANANRLKAGRAVPASPRLPGLRRWRTGPGRRLTRGAQERSVAASPVAITARAGHTSRPRPKPTPGRQQSPDAWPGRRFLRKQRDRGSPGASICARPVVRYRDCRLCCTQNSRGTRKERGHDQHRATVF